MASFSVGLSLLKRKPKAKFPDFSVYGDYEGQFLAKLINVKQLEAKASNCKQVNYI